MLFIFLFVVGALTVPLILDINKNGNNNIIFKSGQEILKYSPIQSIFKSVNVAVDNVNAGTWGVISLCLLGFIIYLIFQLLSFVFSMLFG
jgi:hypothetical protein